MDRLDNYRQDGQRDLDKENKARRTGPHGTVLNDLLIIIYRDV
jgi:hypothetical protein